MEPQEFEIPLVLAGDYDSSPNPLRENSYIEGWNVLLRGSEATPEAFQGTGAAIVNLGTGLAVLELAGSALGNTYVKQTEGGAASWQNNSLFYVGAGPIYYGSGVPFDTATTVLKVRLSTGAFYVVGLQTPGVAPVLTQSAIASIYGLIGTRACVYTEANTATGWESNRSLPSLAVTFQSKQADALFGAPTNANIDGRYIYFTPQGLGGLGQVAPFYRLGGLIPLTGPGAPVAGHKLFDFNDTLLNAFFPAPVGNDPPPTGGGLFVIGFDQLVVLLGTYGGAGISPSDPGNSGVYDPLNTLFPYAVERILAVWPRAAAGYALVATKSTMFAIYPIGGKPGIGLRPLMSNDGVPAGHRGGKFGQDNFFFMCAGGPAVLEQGMSVPQISLNVPVRDEIRRNFDPARTTVGYDPKDSAVVYFGQMQTGPLAGSWVGFPYRIGRGWGPKIIVSGEPQDAITLNDKLYLLINGGLVPWDTAGGSGLIQGWLLRSGAMQVGARDHWKAVDRIASKGVGAGIKGRIFVSDNGKPVLANGDSSAGVPNSGQWDVGNRVFGKAKRVRVRRAKAIQVEFFGAVAGQRVDQTTLAGFSDPRLK